MLLIPGVLEQPTAGQHLAGPAHEGLEHDEFLGGERDVRLAAPDSAACGVEAQVADSQHSGQLDRLAPSEDRSRASSPANENGFVR